MNLVDVKSRIYIDFNVESNGKDSKFEVGDHGKISEYRNVLQKVALQTGLKRFL